MRSRSVRLDKNDRFLTFVVSDGGDSINGDWVIVGDPRLEMATSLDTKSSSREATNK